MLYGVNGKVLEVDLSAEKTREVELSPTIYRRFIGGRGLATYILWKRLGDKWEKIDPLGPENLLIIMTGPLTGYYPGIKVIVSGKSPQTNGVVGSAVSSEVAVELKAAGYDGIIVKGVSRDPVYLYVENDRVEIRDASKLWGKKGSELLEEARRELTSDEKKGLKPTPPILYIGPAGENMVRTAAVMSKLAHAAGYGGYGAVMGSKKLKAIVVRGTKPLPRAAEPGKLEVLWRQIVKKNSEQYRFRQWGTTQGIWSTAYNTSSEPVRNWQEEWHDNRGLSHLVFEHKYWIKNPWADWGCPLACMKISRTIVNGETYLTDGPDYEMGAYLGPNLGIFNPEHIVALSSMADELGLCGIQTGNVMGFAFELYERGILSKEDIGYELKWGDFEAARRLLEDIAYRKGIGDLLAEGTLRAALKINELKKTNTLRYAVQVKGIGVGAHGVRSGKDYPQPIAYAASVQGGDHTSVAGLPKKSKESETWKAFLDSGVVCMFTSFAVDEKTLLEYLNTITGWRVTVDELYDEIGPRILSLQRILLLLGGPDVYWDPRIHDDNPPRFYEPLPSGPYKGSKTDRELVREKLREYYREMGWDEYGIPLNDTLKKLGLHEAIPLVEKIRSRIEGNN